MIIAFFVWVAVALLAVKVSEGFVQKISVSTTRSVVATLVCSAVSIVVTALCVLSRVITSLDALRYITMILFVVPIIPAMILGFSLRLLKMVWARKNYLLAVVNILSIVLIVGSYLMYGGVVAIAVVTVVVLFALVKLIVDAIQRGLRR